MTPDQFLARQQGEIDKAQGILAQAAAENRELSADEVAAIDAATAAVERLDRERLVIERFRATAEGSGTRRTAPGPVGRARGDSRIWGSASYRPREDGAFRALFGAPDGDMAGFGDAREFFAVVASGRYDPRFAAIQASNRTDVAESAGVLVPQPIVAALIDDVAATSAVFGRVRQIGVTAKYSSLPMWRQHDRSAGLMNGFAGEWIGEGQPLAEQNAKATQISVVTGKLGIFTRVTSELLDDAALFASQFQPALTQAAAYSLDRAILRGDGVAKPMGVLNDPSAVTVAKAAGQSADTFSFVNAVAMYSALYAAGTGRATWLVHPSVLPALLLMKDVVTNVAGSENVGGQAAVQMDGAGELRLLGRPVVVSEHLNPLGDKGDVILADLSQYAWFQRSGLSLETSRDAYFQSDEIAFRLLWRGTGQGLWPSAGKRPGDATATESWCVLLAERA